MVLSLTAALLDPQGSPYREIVVAENAPATVKLAATQLQEFIRRRCGTELPLVAESSGEGPAILVGDSPALTRQGLSATEFAPEGYAMKTGNGYLALYGRDYDGPPIVGLRNPWRAIEVYSPELQLGAFGEAGTFTAASEFLQQVCGVRFYLPGELGTVVPPEGDVWVPELDIVSAPQVSYRYPWFSCFELSPESALWARRIGFGGKAPAMIIHSYSFFNRFQESHPEWFALADGHRAFTSECVADGQGHLCLTNPEVIQQWVEDIIAFFRANPEFDVYPLAPNDGLTRICECPTCQAELRPEMPSNGQFSYHIWNFTRKVASEVAKVYPDKFVGCLAYEKYRMPPEEIGELPNVAVMFCNHRSYLGNPQYRNRLHGEIEQWSQKVDRVYLWNWYLDHWLPWTGLPVVFDSTIADELSWLFQNPKYCGEFIESENPPNSPGEGMERYATMATPGLQHWNLYVTARLYLHPELDVRAEFEEYCRLFYGHAAEAMRKFWNKAREAWSAVNVTAEEPAPDAVFPTACLQEMRGFLQAAAEVAVDEPYLARIKMISDEFEQGSSRLIRLESTGSRTLEVPALEEGYVSLAEVLPEQFLTKNGEAVPEAPTWLYAGYDRQSLYFRFLCYEPQMETLTAKVITPGEGAIWEDDSIEIFLCPNEENRKDCYQVIINTNGVVDAGHYLPESGRRDTTWDSGIAATVTKEANRWLLELRVPFAAIGINDPNFVGTLAANFYRNRPAAGQLAATCFSPTGQVAHFVPENFAVVKLNN